MNRALTAFFLAGLVWSTGAEASNFVLAGTTDLFSSKTTTETVAVGCQMGAVRALQIAPRLSGSHHRSIHDKIYVDQIVLKYADGSQDVISTRSSRLGALKPVNGFHRAEFPVSRNECLTSVAITARMALHRIPHGLERPLVADVFVLRQN